jgi:hypothetical protein
MGHLDQTRAWQLFGLAAAERDLLWEEPERALDGLQGAPLVSVDWDRLQPDYRTYDDEARARYRKILGMVADRGFRPQVLLGAGWPWWMGEELWLTPGSPDRFGDHVRRVVEGLGGDCTRYVVHHLSPVDGWLRGAAPPGRWGAVSDAWAVADNVLAAHVLAYEAIHQLVPDASVAVGIRPSTSYQWCRRPLDLLWARRQGIERPHLDDWLMERRRGNDRLEPASSLVEWGVRRTTAVLRVQQPPRAVELLYASPHELVADGVRLDWSVRRRTPTPPDRVRWIDDQRRLTPGVSIE